MMLAVRARPSISIEQALAVKRVTVTDVSVAVIVGQASGTGKTFALDAARTPGTAPDHEYAALPSLPYAARLQSGQAS
ncbi:MAG: hypothetical protein R2702_10065 [Acidimicrobiales bacterium]